MHPPFILWALVVKLLWGKWQGDWWIVDCKFVISEDRVWPHDWLSFSYGNCLLFFYFGMFWGGRWIHYYFYLLYKHMNTNLIYLPWNFVMFLLVMVWYYTNYSTTHLLQIHLFIMLQTYHIFCQSLCIIFPIFNSTLLTYWQHALF